MTAPVEQTVVHPTNAQWPIAIVSATRQNKWERGVLVGEKEKRKTLSTVVFGDVSKTAGKGFGRLLSMQKNVVVI